MDRIGVVDTTFARYDMGAEAVDELEAVPRPRGALRGAAAHRAGVQGPRAWRARS